MGRTDRVGEFEMCSDSLKYLVVLVTASSAEEATMLASDLLEKKLAACINSFPVQSTYLWEGAIQQDQEYQLIIKTASHVFEALEKRIVELHHYDVPEIIALPIMKGSQSYLNWISQGLES